MPARRPASNSTRRCVSTRHAGGGHESRTSTLTIAAELERPDDGCMTNTTMRFEIATNDQCDAEEWWEALAAHGGGSYAEPINELLSNGRIVVDGEQKAQLVAHFRRLPGWDGVESGSHPVVVNEIA